MSHTIKKLEKSQVELTITVTPTEYQKHLEAAATRISQRASIKGFRPGHAPYDMIKKEVGEMGILQEALESVVQEAFYQAVLEEKLDTVGGPKVEIEKVAPANDLVFKAVVALLPTVTLPDIKKIKVTRKEIKTDEKKVDETMDALRGMHAIEIKKDGPAEGTDKLVIDMDLKQDGVSVEGGQAIDYGVYLSEDHYIPGFNEALIGLKAGEEKTFDLPFPKDYFKKQLAGKTATFIVKVKEVFSRELPEVTDEFAQKLGQTDAVALRARIAENINAEAQQKEDQRVEIEMLDAIIEKTKFSELPDVIIDSERHRIYNELLRDLEKHGVDVGQYLADIKKTEEEMMADFTAQAEKRAKAALVSRTIAKEQGITIGDDELTHELELIRTMYKGDSAVEENLKRQDVRETIAVSMQNKKVVRWLKKEILGEETTEVEHVHDENCKH